MLPIDRQILLSELQSVADLIVKMQNDLHDIPVMDHPAGQPQLESFVVELANELQLAGGKLFTLSGILSGN